MFKLIIADDEEKICDLIQILGEWNKFGIEVVAVCHDGEDTLNKIRKLQPDIVLTDIEMPEYNGLELIQKVREEQIGCEFILISGYKQFEYAHTALSYGVLDYILKPIDGTVLNRALATACEKIKNEKEVHSNAVALEINER